MRGERRERGEGVGEGEGIGYYIYLKRAATLSTKPISEQARINIEVWEQGSLTIIHQVPS